MRLPRKARVFAASPFERVVHACFMDEYPRYPIKFIRWNGAGGDLDDAQAMTFKIPAMGGGAIMLVALPRKYEESVVWHEALHVCTFIFQDHGVPITRDNDEVLAYMLAFVKKQITRVLYGAV